MDLSRRSIGPPRSLAETISQQKQTKRKTHGYNPFFYKTIGNNETNPYLTETKPKKLHKRSTSETLNTIDSVLLPDLKESEFMNSYLEKGQRQARVKNAAKNLEKQANRINNPVMKRFAQVASTFAKNRNSWTQQH